MNKRYEPLGGNPLAHLMKSERDATPPLEIVNESGQRMVRIDATYYTEEEAVIERQARHHYWQAYKDKEAKERAVRDDERAQGEARYREYQSRRDGIMPYSEAQEQINQAYEFDLKKRKGVTKGGGIPFGWVFGVIALTVGIAALFAAFGM